MRPAENLFDFDFEDISTTLYDGPAVPKDKMLDQTSDVRRVTGSAPGETGSAPSEHPAPLKAETTGVSRRPDRLRRPRAEASTPSRRPSAPQPTEQLDLRDVEMLTERLSLDEVGMLADDDDPPALPFLLVRRKSASAAAVV